MEPIYEVRTSDRLKMGFVRRAGAEPPAPWLTGWLERASAEHICRLLNADPLPEDKPKRYRLEYECPTWHVVDTETKKTAIRYRRDLLPHAEAMARAECDRLNGGTNG